MLIILFVIIGIVMVSIITYLIIKFCFESKLKTRYIRTPRRALRNQTSDIGCPVTIIVHSSSSNGNIEIDYMDMPPSYSRSNSIHYSPPSYEQAKITQNLLND
ncbi:hypothetical protein RN001_010433 [Aquatica leii]|uniref:Uncharacterized protein n=1 Tax=Aquatica leii TaxID=1421715 RepID=A0AAN7PWD6_9COLE|nr:hypothetical protein RN001_010433 [Aquatica leii]